MGILGLLLLPTTDVVAAAPPAFLGRCGQIFIVGNERIPNWYLLAQIDIHLGMPITPADLDAGNRALARLWLIRPGPTGKYLSLLDDADASDSPFKDLLISIEEGPVVPFVWIPLGYVDEEIQVVFLLCRTITWKVRRFLNDIRPGRPAPPR